MLNLCIFVFIIYATASSARAIIFGNKRKSPSKAKKHNNRNNKIIKINRYRRKEKRRGADNKLAA